MDVISVLKRASALILSLMTPLPGIAAEIKQRPYSYSSDVVKTTDSDFFVVCSDCPDDKLSKEAPPIKLAIRLSVPPPAVVMPAPIEDAKPAMKQEAELKGLIGTVHFDLDRSTLVSREKVNLQQLAKLIPEKKLVAVTGYTCSIGKDAYNETLSYQRARSVASYLMSLGVRVGNVEGKGKCCPVSDDKQFNRRVEVSCP